MSELDDALAELERAVMRLEAAPILGDSDAAAVLEAKRAADKARVEETAAQIAARVAAALDKIDRVLKGEG